MRRIIGCIKRSLRYRKLYRQKKVILPNDSYINNTVFEGSNFVLSQTTLMRCRVGFGSYFGARCHFAMSTIGRYCSIGDNVTVITGRHPTNTYVSTHPAFYSTSIGKLFQLTDKQLFEECRYANPQDKTLVKVGNDVWIGSNVAILDGVKIGDGAIVGANALVTKDLEPYGIYAGIPAKIIGNRFTEKEKNFLLKLRWWEKPEEWIRENAGYFTDIGKLMKKFGDQIEENSFQSGIY
jgi:acetyltransferase-like isoleucine patch superfamily enzyme